MLRWPEVLPRAGRSYELAYRARGGPWEYIQTPKASAAPVLRPATTYELAVAAVGADLRVGPRARTSIRTGMDTSPPAAPRQVRLAAASRSGIRLQLRLAADNVGVVRYRAERQVGRRWVPFAVIPATAFRGGSVGSLQTTPVLRGLRPGTAQVVRMRAQDRRGNLSAGSGAVRVFLPG